jgi:hypothetical protein
MFLNKMAAKTIRIPDFFVRFVPFFPALTGFRMAKTRWLPKFFLTSSLDSFGIKNILFMTLFFKKNGLG